MRCDAHRLTALPYLNLTRQRPQGGESNLAHELGNVIDSIHRWDWKRGSRVQYIISKLSKPIRSTTVIGNNLANDTQGTLKITDVSGRVIQPWKME